MFPCLVDMGYACTSLWVRGICVDYSCRWHWPCCWIHPRSWSGFFRRVGIVVFMWCGFVCIHPRISPCIQPQRIACFRVFIFALFGCGFTLLYFFDPIWIFSRFLGVGGVLMTRLNHVERLSALSGPLFLTHGAGSVSHCFT